MDYEKIVETLDVNKIKKLLISLGVEDIKETPQCLITNTICHNIDGGSMKLYYYKDNHFFYCYSEDGGMSIFTFLKHYYETRGIEYDWYTDIYLVIKNCSLSTNTDGFGIEQYKKLSDNHKKVDKNIKLPVYPAGVLNVFQKVYPEQWIDEGITREALDKFNILFSSSQNKIIIPHYNVNDELVGIRGRALNEWEEETFGKYMPVQIENKWYTHKLSLNLYGLNKTKKIIKETGIVFLVEGEKSVLKIDSFNIPNCSVAVCGSNLNKFQLNILMKECQPKEIILCFDNEEKKNEDKYFMKLYNICKKYNNYANFSFIYDDKNLTGKKDSPVDCGEEIFKELLNKRRKVK